MSAGVPWEQWIARAEATVAAFDARGLERAVADMAAGVSEALPKLQQQGRTDEVAALKLRLEQFVSQCRFLREQLSRALVFATTPSDVHSPYSRFRTPLYASRAPERPLLKRVL